MTASATVPASLTLQSVAHAQTDVLYDVIALLASAETRLETDASIFGTETGQHASRLMEMARAKVNSVLDAFAPHV